MFIVLWCSRFGSLTQSSTVSVGSDAAGAYVYVPMRDIVPMLNPDNLEIDGWDISSVNLEGAVQRARVLDVQLQDKLGEHLRQMKPRPAIFDIDFVADNQVCCDSASTSSHRISRKKNIFTGTHSICGLVTDKIYHKFVSMLAYINKGSPKTCSREIFF